PMPPGRALPRDADAVILFGTKSTLGELAFLRAQGWDHDILAHARTGGRVLGLCGGFQMLGRSIADDAGADGPAGRAQGLGLLDVYTELSLAKTVRTVQGHCLRTGLPVSGYEIHVGRTAGPDCARALFNFQGHRDGARSADGLIEGSYLHGMFTDDDFRRAWLRQAGADGGSALEFGAAVEAALEALADGVEEALDIDSLLACAAAPSAVP
ncbi:MAG: cobyric acid synthase CobQ, partial [Gammaproteobacteria bacterium]|nr:cobyric acid synthase CobQ [Gammaproteobacteria bacterium]